MNTCFENNYIIHNIKSYLDISELLNLLILCKSIKNICLEIIDINKYYLEDINSYIFLSNYKKIKIKELTVSIYDINDFTNYANLCQNIEVNSLIIS